MRGMLLLVVMGLAPTVAAQGQEAPSYPAGTVLVVAPTHYPFAAVEIAGGIKGAEIVEVSLIEAMRMAKQNPSITGVLHIDITADSLIERGRVVCYSPQGAKRWEERVLFNMGGNADRIAEKYASRLAKKTAGKTCP